MLTEYLLYASSIPNTLKLIESSKQPYEVSITISPLSQIRKLRQREVKEPAQSCMSSKQQVRKVQTQASEHKLITTFPTHIYSVLLIVYSTRSSKTSRSKRKKLVDPSMIAKSPQEVQLTEYDQ